MRDDGSEGSAAVTFRMIAGGQTHVVVRMGRACPSRRMAICRASR